MRRQIAVERARSTIPYRNGKEIHTKPDRQRSTHRKQRQDIAGKIDRSDIVYKGSSWKLPEGNFFAEGFVHRLAHPSENPQKIRSRCRTGKRQLSENGLQKRRCQACEQVGKAGGKKETGQNHERKQSRNHFENQSVRPLAAKALRPAQESAAETDTG